MTEAINANQKLIRHEKILGFSIVAQLGSAGYHVDYWIYDIFGTDENGALSWVDKEKSNGDGFTEKLEEASLWAHGYVKWDGCSNWDFDIAKKYKLHACTRKELTRIGSILTICWDWTKAICPDWNDD